MCRFANLLKSRGVKKGDRVSMYLPMIPELAVAMLACARIGAIHTMVFGGFSADALKDRIQDCASNFLITCDGFFRGDKLVNQKAQADQALAACPTVKTCVVVKRVGADKVKPEMKTGRDFWWDEELPKQSNQCECEQVDAEDPLFILYTSGSTGKPKGVMHTTGGYLVYTSYTHKLIFDYHDGDIYFCAADIGWVTGHSYIVYGPLCNGAITMMFEGVPNYPDAGRYWDIVGKHKVNVLYTAPTAIRAIASAGDQHVTSRLNKLDSLRLLGTVGEPINPEAWRWYYEKPGRSKCPIVDTWWQTETGGILITGLPGAIDMKPGKATTPFFGVEPVIVDPEKGTELEGRGERRAVHPASVAGADARRVRRPGPVPHHLLRPVRRLLLHRRRLQPRHGRRLPDHGPDRRRHQRLRAPHGHGRGRERAGAAPEGGRGRGRRVPPRDQGAGHLRLRHPERGGAGRRRAQEGAGGAGAEGDRRRSPAPDHIQWAPGLPKTRSGKIMRRILRKIAANEVAGGFGDTSTLLDPGVVDQLVETRMNKG